MAKYAWKAGATSKTILVRLLDTQSATGGGKTGITTTMLNIRSIRVSSNPGDDPVTIGAITPVALASIATAWTSGGWKEIDSTNAPGWYRFDIPDETIETDTATGALNIRDNGVNFFADCPIEIQLTPAAVDVVLTDGDVMDTPENVLNSIIDGVHDKVIEGSSTFQELMRLVVACVQGDSTGLDTESPVYKGLDGSKNRWTGDASGGNRTNATRDLTP